MPRFSAAAGFKIALIDSIIILLVESMTRLMDSICLCKTATSHLTFFKSVKCTLQAQTQLVDDRFESTIISLTVSYDST